MRGGGGVAVSPSVAPRDDRPFPAGVDRALVASRRGFRWGLLPTWTTNSFFETFEHPGNSICKFVFCNIFQLLLMENKGASTFGMKKETNRQQ